MGKKLFKSCVKRLYRLLELARIDTTPLNCYQTDSTGLVLSPSGSKGQVWLAQYILILIGELIKILTF